MSGHNFWQHFEGNPVISDPGHAGAISNAQSGICYLYSDATNAVGTRTLAAPAREGQAILLIYRDDTGTSCTVTIPTALDNSTTTLAFTAISDHALLVGAKNASGTLQWCIIDEVTT